MGIKIDALKNQNLGYIKAIEEWVFDFILLWWLPYGTKIRAHPLVL